MEPFYFGPEERQLFGVYHPPGSGPDRDVGVVLCYPMGQEYVRSHRAFRQLAIQLSEAGFHTLRFDLSGCGDSARPFEESDLGLWVEDTRTALVELREGSGAARSCLVGLRLGGAIATLAAAAHDVECLVVWDGVVDGREYLAEIRTQHEEWSRNQPRPPKGTDPSRGEEALGFPLAPPLVSDLRSLDLLRHDTAPARRAFFVDTGPQGSSALLCQRFQGLGVDTERQYVEAPAVWVKQSDELGDSTVPAAVLDTLVAWIQRAYP